MVERTDPQVVKQIEKIKRKADQQTTAHAWMRDLYEFRHSLFTTISLISGLFLLATIAASPASVSVALHISTLAFQWILVVIGVASYSIVVLILAWRFDVRAERHDQAVRHYTKAAFHASRLLQRQFTPTPAELGALETEYLDDRDLPRIPEARFLKLKKWHLQKVQESKELSQEFDKPGDESEVSRR
jgi:hypothetical protein